MLLVGTMPPFMVKMLNIRCWLVEQGFFSFFIQAYVFLDWIMSQAF